MTDDDAIDIDTLAGLYQCVRDLQAERDRLLATLDAEREQWLKETRHAASRIGSANRERDRLRAVVDSAEIVAAMLTHSGTVVGGELFEPLQRLRNALIALDGSEATDG